MESWRAQRLSFPIDDRRVTIARGNRRAAEIAVNGQGLAVEGPGLGRVRVSLTSADTPRIIQGLVQTGPM
jgi:hypothetical protein